MADITMCINKTCPKARSCYRKTAPVNEHRQSVADFKYGFDELGRFFCENFYPRQNDGKA